MFNDQKKLPTECLKKSFKHNAAVAHKSKPKMNAVGQNFTMGMTWKCLIPLSPSKKLPKKHFWSESG